MSLHYFGAINHSSLLACRFCVGVLMEGPNFRCSQNSAFQTMSGTKQLYACSLRWVMGKDWGHVYTECIFSSEMMTDGGQILTWKFLEEVKISKSWPLKLMIFFWFDFSKNYPYLFITAWWLLIEMSCKLLIKKTKNHIFCAWIDCLQEGYKQKMLQNCGKKWLHGSKWPFSNSKKWSCLKRMLLIWCYINYWIFYTYRICFIYPGGNTFSAVERM